MLRKNLMFIFLSALLFITKVVTEDDLELEVEVDGKEEKELMDAMETSINAEAQVDVNNGADQIYGNDNGNNANEDNMELEVELDTNEEKNIVDDLNANNNDITKVYDENGANEQPDNTDIVDDIDQSQVTGDNNLNYAVKLKNENASKGDQYLEDTHEAIKKFKERPKPLWKIKDFPDSNRESGFDLTLEEMKKFKMWKDGVIPYYIDVVSFSDKVLRDKIRNFLQMVNSATGINFVELPGPPEDDKQRWVFFMNRRGLLGCADHSVKSFTNQGVQQVVLGYDCMETRGELAEAVMSILGVPAQHNAPDRDKYIQVNMDNIMPDKKQLFEKLNDNEWLFHDMDYDYNSITHYDIFKYSANGRPTIQLKNYSKDFNPAKTLSSDDLLKIKMLYNYVTRNAQMNAPECDKLFKPRNKFERFVPNKVYVKPREKPSRYLSNSNSGRMSLKETYEDTYRDNYLKQLIKNAETLKNEKSKQLNYENTNRDLKEYTEKIEEKDTPNEASKEKERRIRKTEALTILSDYHSDEI